MKYVKADRINKWTTTLEEEYSQFKYLPNKNYRSEYKTLSTNPLKIIFSSTCFPNSKKISKSKIVY